MSEIDYKLKCEHYEKLLGIGQYDPVKSAFVVYVKMINQQVNFLNEFNIKSHITETDKENPKYSRAMDMISGLPKMITSVNELRSTLKLTKDDILQIEDNKVVFAKIMTPESIADTVNDFSNKKS